LELSQALRECARWHETPEVVIRGSEPPELAAWLTRCVG
jgi:hypothetical protein